MKNKGFTLIELLAVIFIVGMISTLALVSITKYSGSFKRLSQAKVDELIISSAKSYISSNNELKNDAKAGETVQISYQTLYEEGYLPDSLRDIKSSKNISNSQYASYCVQVNYEENHKFVYNIIKTTSCD